MHLFWEDIHRSLRTLLKRPAFSGVCLLTLAMGIGANTAIFSVSNAILLRPLPFRDEEHIFWITGVRPYRSDAPFSLPDFLDYRDRVSSLDSLSAMGTWSGNLTGQGDAEQLTGVRVSANLFQTLGVNAELGRTLLPDDDRPGRPPVVVMTNSLWKRRFGGDAGLIGTQVNLNGVSYTVVGVLPPNFFFPIAGAELAVPLIPDSDPWRLNRNSVNFLRFVGRTRANTSPQAAQAEMNSLADKLRQQFPDSNARKLGVKLTPMRDQITGSFRRALWVLLGAVGLMLLVACANLANLNLVRASGRRREISIRSALGATRWHIIKQLLLEGALLAAAGGVLGVSLSPFAVRGLLTLTPATIPRAGEISLDAPVLAFTILISLMAAAVTGLAPALAISRGELALQLNEASRGSTEGAGGKALRTAFVVAQVTLSLVLLAGAGLLLKSFTKVQTVRPGFDPHGILTVRLSLPKNRYPHLSDVFKFYDALNPAAQTLPGVSSAGVTQMLPLSGLISRIPFTVVGRAFSKEEIPEAEYRLVSPMYLKVMRIPLLEGREFNESDTDRTQLVCYINQTLAKRYWPSNHAVGAHLMINDNNAGPREAQIVAVIENVKDRGLETAPSFDIYIPMRQTPEEAISWFQNFQYWVLRTQNDPLALADTFRAQVRTIDAEVAASNVRSMEEYYSMSIAPRRFNLQLLSFFALAAFALAMAGIYGVISYSVNHRAHEIGVRMAIGAQRGHILRMVITDGMKPVVAGLTLGILIVLGLTKVLATLLFGVTPSDPSTLMWVTFVFCGVALAALVVPAFRAARIDPLGVLRTN